MNSYDKMMTNIDSNYKNSEHRTPYKPIWKKKVKQVVEPLPVIEIVPPVINTIPYEPEDKQLKAADKRVRKNVNRLNTWTGIRT